MAKKALQHEIDRYVRKYGDPTGTDGDLVVLDDEGQTTANPTLDDLREYEKTGKVRGKWGYSIGVSFTEGENQLAVSIDPSEVEQFARFYEVPAKSGKSGKQLDREIAEVLGKKRSSSSRSHHSSMKSARKPKIIEAVTRLKGKSSPSPSRSVGQRTWPRIIVKDGKIYQLTTFKKRGTSEPPSVGLLDITGMVSPGDILLTDEGPLTHY